MPIALVGAACNHLWLPGRYDLTELKMKGGDDVSCSSTPQVCLCEAICNDTALPTDFLNKSFAVDELLQSIKQMLTFAN